MALLTYSPTYLIPRHTFSHMGSSHGVLIGKRLVGNMNIESEVRFFLLLVHHLFVMLEGLYAFLRPFTSNTTSILYVPTRGIYIPVPFACTVWSYRMLLREAVLWI